MTDDDMKNDKILERAQKRAGYLFELINEKLDEIGEDEPMSVIGALCQVMSVKLLINCMIVIDNSENTQEFKDQHIERVSKEVGLDAKKVYEEYKNGKSE